MTGIVEVGGLLLTLFSAYLLYCYATYRGGNETCTGGFWRPNVRRGELIYVLIIAAAALVTAGYGRYRNEYSIFQCYLNIAMLFLLAAMAYIDFREKIIPNHLILVGFGLWGVEILVEAFVFHTSVRQILLFSLLGGGIWGGLLILIALFVKTALGMGDAKMFFVIGLIYGLNNTYSILLISLVIMAVVSVALLIIKKADKKTAVPMAPFVLIGFVFCIFAGM